MLYVGDIVIPYLIILPVFDKKYHFNARFISKSSMDMHCKCNKKGQYMFIKLFSVWALIIFSHIRRSDVSLIGLSCHV